MPTRLNREDFLRQLESVQPGLSPREIVEQSSCFVFKDKQVITYNDEIACSHKCSLKITGAVQAVPLLGLLKKMVEEEVELDVGEGELLISGKNRRGGITMEKEITLPIDTVEKPDGWIELHADFSDAINLVQQCAGKDESKFSTTCVHLHPKWVEAFDNYQMARYRMKTGVKASTLVRRDSIKHIISLGMTEFSETESWIHFRNPLGLVLSCRRWVEDYIDLEELVTMQGQPATLPKGLGEAVDRAEVFSAENADENQITVTLRPGKMRIKGKGASGWWNEVKKLKYSGKPLDFQISPKLLMELSRRHNECEVGPQGLKVTAGKFVYVTSLEKPEEE